MTDGDAHADAHAPPAPTTTAGREPTATSGPSPVDRRSFVRSIAGDGITAAGRLAGFSGMLTGAMIAGARAANDSLAALGAPGPSPTSRPVAPPIRAPNQSAAPSPAGGVTLSDADRAVLEALTLGLLATNQAGGAPAVGIVRFRFDGTAFRIPGRSATARTGNLQRDPFAAITLIDPATGDALFAAGRVRIVYGADGRDAAADVLAACEVPLPDGWDAADSRGEPVLIVLEVQRLFRRKAADERP